MSSDEGRHCYVRHDLWQTEVANYVEGALTPEAGNIASKGSVPAFDEPERECRVKVAWEDRHGSTARPSGGPRARGDPG